MFGSWLLIASLQEPKQLDLNISKFSNKRELNTYIALLFKCNSHSVNIIQETNVNSKR